MVSKNILTDGKNLGIAGGILSVISVFLPWFSEAGAPNTGTLIQHLCYGLGWKMEKVSDGAFDWKCKLGIERDALLALGIASIVDCGSERKIAESGSFGMRASVLGAVLSILEV